MADSVVAGWLAELSLCDLIPTFRDEGVDSVALAGLEDGQLKELGVKRMGDRSKLRAKATGVALPRPVASTSKAATTFLVGGSASGVHVPEHLRVLNRLSGSPSKPKRTTVDDLADKITATNFVLAGGPLEKYTNGGKGKPHKKILRMLPDKRLSYDGKSVGPVLSVLDGGGSVTDDHHKVTTEVAARTFRVVCDGGVTLVLIAPCKEDKVKWMEGIEIMLIGGYKRKDPSASRPPSAAAPRAVSGAATPAEPAEGVERRRKVVSVAPGLVSSAAARPHSSRGEPESRGSQEDSKALAQVRAKTSGGAERPAPLPTKTRKPDVAASQAPQQASPGTAPPDGIPAPAHSLKAGAKQPRDADRGADVVATRMGQQALRGYDVEVWGTAAGVTVQGGAVIKECGVPEYGIALARQELPRACLGWEVVVDGDVHWCGIGVACQDVGTDDSLRRPHARGKAWFYHSKGFLCDGDRFVGDDGVPPFRAGDRVAVRMDGPAGRLTFLLNGTPVPGAIEGVGRSAAGSAAGREPKVVVPAVYMDGACTRLTMTASPAAV